MKKLKWTLLLLLLFALTASLLAVPALAATSGDYKYTVTDGKATINSYSNRTATTVYVPSSLGGYPVTAIGSSAFSYCRSLTDVTIPRSVTSIGSGVFRNCNSLTAIHVEAGSQSFQELNGVLMDLAGTTIIASPAGLQGDYLVPEGVTSIRNYAFDGCSCLTSVTIPEGVTSIGDYAFSGCSSLTAITIPDSVTYVGSSAFSDTAYYKDPSNWDNDALYIGKTLIRAKDTTEGEFTVKSGTVCIGSGAFYGCKGLTGVTIPESVTGIGSSAFYDCSGLTGVTIPESVTSIGGSAFYGCRSLTEATIPESVTSIGGYAFYDCRSLTDVTIPEGVTSIGDWAFSFCSSLTSITIPEGVTSIGERAFSGCRSLTSVTIPAGVTSIGNSAFSGCSGLTGITIPAGVTDIGSSAFSGCSGLMGITIPESVTSIGNSAFSGCRSLTSVTIPAGVTSIGREAFSECTSLTAFHVEPGSQAFRDLDGVLADPAGTTILSCPAGLQGDYLIPEGVTSIGENAFHGCSGLTGITIPESVTSIGREAFSECVGLTSVTVPDSVTSIGNYAFAGCTALESMTLPFVGTSARSETDTWQYPLGILFEAFSYDPDAEEDFGRDGITLVTQRFYGDDTSDAINHSYYIPSSLRSVTVTGGSILRGAFSDCSMLRSVTISENATSIGISAFNGCSGLTSITIPESVTTIDGYAFYDCSSLTNVSIPKSVTSIGISVFNNCSSELEIHYGGSLSEWNNVQKNSVIERPVHFADLTPAQGSCGENAYYTMDPGTGVLTIGGSGPVTGAPWKAAWAYVRSVTIGSGIETIPADAFKDCWELKTAGPAGSGCDLEFGWTRTIPENAFSGANTLERIELPAVVLKLGDKCFANCSSLQQLRIPGTLETIGTNVISGCTALDSLGGIGSGCALEIPWKSLYLSAFLTGNKNLKRVEIPAGITGIGGSRFRGCSGLTSVTIPAGVTSIGSFAFSGCRSLTSATIPESVTSIGNSAFSGCSGLTGITIPAGVTDIGSSAFSGCSGLMSNTITACWTGSV